MKEGVQATRTAANKGSVDRRRVCAYAVKSRLGRADPIARWQVD